MCIARIKAPPQGSACGGVIAQAASDSRSGSGKAPGSPSSSCHVSGLGCRLRLCCRLRFHCRAEDAQAHAAGPSSPNVTLGSTKTPMLVLSQSVGALPRAVVQDLPVRVGFKINTTLSKRRQPLFSLPLLQRSQRQHPHTHDFGTESFCRLHPRHQDIASHTPHRDHVRTAFRIDFRKLPPDMVVSYRNDCRANACRALFAAVAAKLCQRLR